MTKHKPVMTAEMVELLAPKEGGIYVDGSFGGGGHTQAILAAASCSVLAIDRDPAACARGEKLAASYSGRLAVVEGRFGDLSRLLADKGIDSVDGITFDAGFSSDQLEDAGRGFSFMHDGALDMRMEQGQSDMMTAADWLASLEEKDLARILAVYGEEKAARRIARALTARRDTMPITRTGQLREAIEEVMPAKRSGRVHPATRTFQALRILVNDELGELARGLAAAEKSLCAGGRLAVISFHSLEDRIVKQFLQVRSERTGAGVSRFMPLPPAPPPASFSLLTRRPRRPGADEIARNPRARSARLRAAVRTAAPVFPAPAASSAASALC